MVTIYCHVNGCRLLSWVHYKSGAVPFVDSTRPTWVPLTSFLPGGGVLKSLVLSAEPRPSARRAGQARHLQQTMFSKHDIDDWDCRRL